MAVAARKNEYIYAPSRVYSHSYGSAAAAEALPQHAPEQERARRRPVPRPAPLPAHEKTRVNRINPAAERKKRTLPKIASVTLILMAAAVGIGLMVRYNSIAAEYSYVNDLRENIEASRQNIAALNVQLNSGISLDQVKETALATGMNYPTAEQIVRVGASNSDAADGTKPD